MNGTEHKKYRHIDLGYLDLMTDGDDDMKKTMLEMLFKEPAEEIAKMRRLAESAAWAELSKVSHKMKTTLAFVGNDEMTVKNKRIELLTKNNTDLHEVPALIDRLAELFQLALVELKAEYDSL